MELTRRGFLQALGVGAAGMTLGPLLPGGGTAYAAHSLSFGSRGPAVADLQRKLGFVGREVDHVLGKNTLGRVIALQCDKGLVPDGVVGPLTMRYVNNRGLPPASTSFKATGAKRIVLDKRNRIVFLVRPNGTVERFGWGIHNPQKTRSTTTRASEKIRNNRNLNDAGQPGDLILPHFVRFDGKPGNGFHAIPVDKKTGKQIHSETQLGRGTRQISKGCVRLSALFAKQLYEWTPVGAAVTAVDSMRAGV